MLKNNLMISKRLH